MSDLWLVRPNISELNRQVLERDHRKLCDAVEEDTRWLRDAVEVGVGESAFSAKRLARLGQMSSETIELQAFAVMLHPQVLICQAISESPSLGSTHEILCVHLQRRSALGGFLQGLGLDLATLGESFRSVRGCLVLAGKNQFWRITIWSVPSSLTRAGVCLVTRVIVSSKQGAG